MSYSLHELENLYDKCLKLAPDKRKNFISDKSKGNKLLEDTLKAMLSEHSRIDDYFDDLQKRIVNSLNPDAAILPPGTIIDKYKIIELISEGGMGQVYKAERADGQFNHIVAVKCLSAPLSNKDFMLKFRQEQQILANLQHRTIASLYDGGITETGIPYIIMEYINGLPFDQYVKDNDLTENRIIQLFIDVCYAVQSAHNQFVLHQDIKPNNILINANGDAKLLDFGVARIISETNRQREFHGTPTYASPEQMMRNEVSVATDIYQLGVLLHKLLTGNFPFDEPNRLVPDREVHLDPHSLSVELQSIIKKCLQEEQSNRYQMVSDLIADLTAYQNNYPVSTLPNTFGYKTKKYIRRNAAMVSLISLVIITLFAGIIISLSQANIAREQKNLALSETEKNKQITDFLLSVFEAANPEENFGKEVLVEDIIQQSVKKIPQFEEDNVKAQMLGVLGEVALISGNYILADSLLNQAISINQMLQPQGYVDDQVTNHENLAFLKMNQADFEGAINTIREGAELALLNNIENEEEYLSLQVMGVIVLTEKGDLQKADSLLKATTLLLNQNDYLPQNEAQVYNQQAHLFLYQGKVDSAIYFLHKAQRLMSQNHPVTHPFYLSLNSNLAVLYRQKGAYEKALEIIESTIEYTRQIFGANHLRYLKSLNTQGLCYLSLKEYDMAIQKLSEARNIFRENSQEESVGNILTNGNLARAYIGANQYDSALDVSQKTFALAQSVIPTGSTYYHWVARILAEAEYKNNQMRKAEKRLENALVGLAQVNGPESATTVSTATFLAKIYRENSKPEKADSLTLKYQLEQN